MCIVSLIFGDVRSRCVCLCVLIVKKREAAARLTSVGTEQSGMCSDLFPSLHVTKTAEYITLSLQLIGDKQAHTRQLRRSYFPVFCKKTLKPNSKLASCLSQLLFPWFWKLIDTWYTPAHFSLRLSPTVRFRHCFGASHIWIKPVFITVCLRALRADTQCSWVKVPADFLPAKESCACSKRS